MPLTARSPSSGPAEGAIDVADDHAAGTLLLRRPGPDGGPGGQLRMGAETSVILAAAPMAGVRLHFGASRRSAPRTVRAAARRAVCRGSRTIAVVRVRDFASDTSTSGGSSILGVPAGPPACGFRPRMRGQGRQAGIAVIVERDLAVGGDDVVADISFARLDPDRLEPGARISLEKREGEDVACARREEHAVGQRPLPWRSLHRRGMMYIQAAGDLIAAA